jgi:ribosomal protein S18 acetylase RimI-like enzyme
MGANDCIAPPNLQPVRVRAASPSDDAALAALLYETAGGMYDLFTGGAERAARILVAACDRSGNSASREVISVVELDGRVVGAMAAFPVSEADTRARAFLRLTLGRTPPWRWPRTLKVFRLGGRLTPPAPLDALYVDSLATDAGYRRRGVATALLGAAEERARALGLTAIALDTAERNASAQALYEGVGMRRSGSSQGIGAIPGAIAYLKPV